MLSLLFAMFALAPSSVLTVPIIPVEEIIWTPEMVRELATNKAKEYGLHTKRFLATIECESGFESVQSNHYYKGEREESYGVAQIHLPSHPSVTKEMALEPSFAVDWMAKQWVNDDAELWSCYRLLYK